MSRIVLLNGEFLDFADAKLSIMDRGFLFADGIYEVSAVLNGRTIDNAAHLARLDRSLKEIDIPNPYSVAEWVAFQNGLIERNGLTEGVVYIQVTRGAAEREFSYAEGLTPTVVMFTQVKNLLGSKLAVDGAKPCRTCAGRGAILSLWPCCPKCSPNKPQPARAHKRPGWWKTGSSPKVPPPPRLS
jgi:D-alanine transaminase